MSSSETACENHLKFRTVLYLICGIVLYQICGTVLCQMFLEIHLRAPNAHESMLSYISPGSFHRSYQIPTTDDLKCFDVNDME